jgi:hypothetical protein
MRASTIGLACSLLFALTSAVPAGADEAATAAEPAAEQPASAPKAEAAAAGEQESAPAEEAAGGGGAAGALLGYGKHVANTFLAGVNGVITWPADPVMLTIQPTDAMRTLPGGVVTGHVVGFFAGTLQGLFRVFGGTLDIALCPLTFFPMFSIEPRYKLIPGWEHAG